MSTEKSRRSEKIQMFDDIARLIVGAQFVYFVTYKGLRSKDLAAFRNLLAKNDAQCHILKNRLVRKVAELNGMTALAHTKMTGDTAVIIGGGDAGQIAKTIEEFMKTTKGILAPKAGYYEGAMLSDKEVIAIAALPSKDVLRAQLLGLLNTVPTGLVRVLNAKVASIVNVVNAYKNKLEEKA
ncbi:MAG: 50S ribosomal protein L10 [Lentisphaerae bacterium ADurb.Bin242]|nr:MAG: 50S ribosomal protein L10 [Lentisphaerae bacterium ADurb.Bin242]